jgi:hypothetical protein
MSDTKFPPRVWVIDWSVPPPPGGRKFISDVKCKYEPWTSLCDEVAVEYLSLREHSALRTELAEKDKEIERLKAAYAYRGIVQEDIIAQITEKHAALKDFREALEKYRHISCTGSGVSQYSAAAEALAKHPEVKV